MTQNINNSWVIIWWNVRSITKIITIKSIFSASFGFIQPSHSFLKILKKKELLSLLLRRQKFDPFYLKFRAELNEFIPRVQK